MKKFFDICFFLLKFVMPDFSTKFVVVVIVMVAVIVVVAAAATYSSAHSFARIVHSLQTAHRILAIDLPEGF